MYNWLESTLPGLGHFQQDSMPELSLHQQLCVHEASVIRNLLLSYNDSKYVPSHPACSH